MDYECIWIHLCPGNLGESSLMHGQVGDFANIGYVAHGDSRHRHGARLLWKDGLDDYAGSGDADCHPRYQLEIFYDLHLYGPHLPGGLLLFLPRGKTLLSLMRGN